MAEFCDIWHICESEQIADFASKLSKALGHTFTLRHYTSSNTYSSVKSNFALWNERVITTSNTAAKDWWALGASQHLLSGGFVLMV